MKETFALSYLINKIWFQQALSWARYSRMGWLTNCIMSKFRLFMGPESIVSLLDYDRNRLTMTQEPPSRRWAKRTAPFSMASYGKCGTHARVSSLTPTHGNSKNKIRHRNRGSKWEEKSEYGMMNSGQETKMFRPPSCIIIIIIIIFIIIISFWQVILRPFRSCRFAKK